MENRDNRSLRNKDCKDFSKIGLDMSSTDINNQKGDVFSHDLINQAVKAESYQNDGFIINLLCGEMPYVHYR